MEDNSSNECSSDALKSLRKKKERINDAQLQLILMQSTHKGYNTDRSASKSLDFTFSMEMTRDEASCAGSRERRVLNIFESRQKK
jgi:hypothetical protein